MPMVLDGMIDESLFAGIEGACGAALASGSNSRTGVTTQAKVASNTSCNSLALPSPPKQERGNSATAKMSSRSDLQESIGSAGDDEACDNGGADGDIDDQMMEELFGDESPIDKKSVDDCGRGQHQGSSRPRFVERCALCCSTEADRDLSGSQATTPFVRRRSRTSDDMVTCDHCEYLLRYNTLDSSSVGGLLTVFQADSNRRTVFLNMLACCLALKATESQAKVHSKTLAKTLNIVDKHAEIKAELANRSKREHADSGDRIRRPGMGMGNDDQDSRSMMIMGLADYYKERGNPLVNQERLGQALINDQYQVVILAADSAKKGRHALAPVVSAAAGEISSPSLTSLRSLTVDSMDGAKLVRDIVVEFSTREKVKRQLHGLAPTSPTASRQSGGEDESTRGGRSCGASTMHSVGDEASGAGAAASQYARSPAKTSELATPKVKQEVPTPAKAKSSSSMGAMEHSVASEGKGLDGHKEDWPSPTTCSIRMGIDRCLDGVAQRLVTFAGYCVKADWMGNLRGKEGTIERFLDRRLKTEETNAKKCRREDRLRDLDHVRWVAHATRVLVQWGKAVFKKREAELNPVVLWQPIGIVSTFLEAARQAKLADDDCVLDVSLRKCEARRALLGGGAMGQVKSRQFWRPELAFRA